MAIYSFQMGTVSRDKKSAGGSLANASTAKKARYIKREGQYANRPSPKLSPLSSDINAAPKSVTHQTERALTLGDVKTSDQAKYIFREEQFEDRHEDEIVFKGSGNMPKWPKLNPQDDDQHYWNACDKYERANGRLARTFIVALPRELSDEQRLEMANLFVSGIAKTNDGIPLPYSFAIHQDKDNHNPHMHVMISERVNDGIPRNASTWFKRANSADPKKGGARKTEDLKSKSWLYGARKNWEITCNRGLEVYGHLEQIDCRSLKAQGLDRVPTVHLGKAAHIGQSGRPSKIYERRKGHNEKVVQLERLETEISRIAKYRPVPDPLTMNAYRSSAARKITPGKPIVKAIIPRASLNKAPVLRQNATPEQWLNYILQLTDVFTNALRRMIENEAERARRLQDWKFLRLKLEDAYLSYAKTPESWHQDIVIKKKLFEKFHPATFKDRNVQTGEEIVKPLDWAVVNQKAPWVSELLIDCHQNEKAAKVMLSIAAYVGRPETGSITCARLAEEYARSKEKARLSGSSPQEAAVVVINDLIHWLKDVRAKVLASKTQEQNLGAKNHSKNKGP